MSSVFGTVKYTFHWYATAFNQWLIRLKVKPHNSSIQAMKECHIGKNSWRDIANHALEVGIWKKLEYFNKNPSYWWTLILFSQCQRRNIRQGSWRGLSVHTMQSNPMRCRHTMRRYLSSRHIGTGPSVRPVAIAPVTNERTPYRRSRSPRLVPCSSSAGAWRVAALGRAGVMARVGATSPGPGRGWAYIWPGCALATGRGTRTPWVPAASERWVATTEGQHSLQGPSIRTPITLSLNREVEIDGLAQDCGNSSAFALKLPQSCAKPSKCVPYTFIPTACFSHWKNKTLNSWLYTRKYWSISVMNEYLSVSPT